MRLTSLAMMSCLACDAGAAKVEVAAPANVPRAPAGAVEAKRATPVSAPPAGASALSRPVASEARTDGKPDCRFERPASWAAGQVEWLGGCRHGFAEGNGVIVDVVEGAEPERFYGRLDGGSPSVGVLQTESGFVAGRWAHGALAEPLPEDVAQRNVLLDAFRIAAEAASAVSKSLAKNGDTEKSGFYARQAHALGEQMD
jgi:hypothetical protein